MPELVRVSIGLFGAPAFCAIALGDPEDTLEELIATAERFGIDVDPEAINIALERSCRGCGCTVDRACITENGPCHWVEPDLCSGCAKTMVLRP